MNRAQAIMTLQTVKTAIFDLGGGKLAYARQLEYVIKEMLEDPKYQPQQMRDQIANKLSQLNQLHDHPTAFATPAVMEQLEERIEAWEFIQKIINALE